MRNFQDTFEARKQSFISAFSVCMAVPGAIFRKTSIMTVLHKYVSEYSNMNEHGVVLVSLLLTLNIFHILF